MSTSLTNGYNKVGTTQTSLQTALDKLTDNMNDPKIMAEELGKVTKLSNEASTVGKATERVARAENIGQTFSA